MKDINLIPPELKEERQKKKKVALKLFSAAFLLGFISLLIALPLAYMNRLYGELKIVNEELNKYRNVSELQQNIKDISLYLEKKKSIIDKVNKKKIDLVKLSEDVASNLPQDVSVTHLKYDNEVLEIEGEALHEGDIAVFMLNLRSINYVEDVKVLSVELNEKNVYKYVVQVKVRVVS
ncbi:PilN domain-containing protein [Caldanaerobacter sp.]|uniref:PilN domain-containing protein n=1 Tax=Caldanaerobacter sp. TaxID=2930036 RepID=UPI003C768650